MLARDSPIRADEGAFDVAGHGIDPLECVVPHRLVVACSQRNMCKSLIRNRRKAVQTICKHPALAGQKPGGSLGNRPRCKARYREQLHSVGLAVICGFHGRHRWDR